MPSIDRFRRLSEMINQPAANGQNSVPVGRCFVPVYIIGGGEMLSTANAPVSGVEAMEKREPL